MKSNPALHKLGAEVSASLEQARIASHRDGASSGVRARLLADVKLKSASPLRKSDKHALSISSSNNARWGRDSSQTPRRILSDRAVRTILGGLAFAATIAVSAFFAWPHHFATHETARAQKDPVLSFVIGDPNSVKHEGTVGAFIAANGSSMPVTFSDGSNLRLEPTARVRVAEVADNGARVHIESGTVHVSVVHKTEQTKWAVEAGPYEVRVTGTKFDVAWDPTTAGLVVKLNEGSVFVKGCGLGDDGKKLTAGEELRTTCSEPDALKKSSPPPPFEKKTEADRSVVVKADNTLEKKDTKAVSPDALVVAPPTPAPTAVTAPGPAKVDSVATLARRGAHAEALAAAESNGFATTCDSLQAPELLLLADAARYAGRFDRATEALEATRHRFAGSDAAATAAFELGRIEMDVRRDLTGAGDHFELYLRERPSGSLAREALGRGIEARHRAGENAKAERLAVRYLATYPDGPHAKLARKLTSPSHEPAP